MKTNPLTKKLALAIALTVVAFGLVVYASTVVIVAIGTFPTPRLLAVLARLRFGP